MRQGIPAACSVKPERQPADAGADDDDVVHVSFPAPIAGVAGMKQISKPTVKSCPAGYTELCRKIA